jgi:hypothetical protein
MRKEFVVKSVDAPPDGAQYVIISLTSAKEFREGNKPQFDPSKINPGDMNDMMKNLNKMLSGMGGMPGGTTQLKLDMHEYKKMNLSVGDKVYLDLTKEEDFDV